MQKKLATILIPCTLAILSVPALANDGVGYFLGTQSNTTQVDCDGIIPYDGWIGSNNSVFYYIGGSYNGSGKVEEGICKWRDNLDIFHPDYYFSYVDTSGTFNYEKEGNITEANGTAATFIFNGSAPGSSGYWGGETIVNGTAYPTTSNYYTGYASVDDIYAEVDSTCYANTGGSWDPFSNLWDYDGASNPWVRLTNATFYETTGGTYECDTSHPWYEIQANGTVNNGSQANISMG